MHKIWENNFWYSLGRRYVDLCARTSFSSLKIEGLENIPEDGAVLFAPNHCAAMMDAMMVLQTHKGIVGFGARSDIFQKSRTASALRWLRILPIARERNGLKEVARNFEIFDEIVDCIGHGVPFCMFSEGTHRAERGMMPVKKGVFRIAKMASARLGTPVYIVPMGIYYEYFFRQFGRAAIRIGRPFEISEYFNARSGEPEAEIYRNLCEDLRSSDMSLLKGLDERGHGHIAVRAAASVLSLPIFAICVIGALPIWMPAALIMNGMEDKAWTHTVNYVCRFIFPVLWPFWWGAFALFNTYDYLIKDLHK